MPAEGAMATRLEAPAQEPRDVQSDVVLDGVTRRFGDVVALQDVSLRACGGQVVAVVGPSGSGKSTLLELVCGLQQPDAGTVRAGRAVLMPQSDLLLPWLDARDNAALPLRIAGVGRDAARDRAHALLAELGLDGFEHARTWELSGGMRQRVAAARTLLAGAPLLCLDPPFGRAGPGRPLARAGPQDPRRGGGLAAPRPGARAAHRAVGPPRRRGGRAARR